MSKSHHHIVYRMFATNGDLLYVGKTHSFETRLAQHQAKQPWFEDVETITLEHCINGAEASVVEEAAIRTERPLYNTQYTELGVLLKKRHVRYVESCSIAESVKLLGLVDEAGAA